MFLSCCTARFGTPVCGHVTKLTCLNNDLKDPEIKVGILGLIMVGILGLFYGRNFGTIPRLRSEFWDLFMVGILGLF